MPEYLTLPRGILHRHSGTLMLMFRFLDMLMVFVAAWGIYVWRSENWWFNSEAEMVVLVTMLSAVVIFSNMGLYQGRRGLPHFTEQKHLLKAWGLLLGFMLFFLYFTKMGEEIPRLWIGGWISSGLLTTIALRLVLREGLKQFRLRGYNTRQLLLLGEEKRNREIKKHLIANPDSGFQVCSTQAISFKGLSAPRKIEKMENETKENINHSESWLQELRNTLSENQIDQIWITLPMLDYTRMLHILQDLEYLPLGIRWVPDQLFTGLLKHGVTDISGLPIINLGSNQMNPAGEAIKSMFDYSFALLVLVLFSPLLLCIALAIKLGSPGPVLFRQWRHGYNGRPVEIWKFRTMQDFDKLPRTFSQAKKEDVRITFLGKYLRRTSLDEFPQFFNVLQGRLSVVGPRPHPLLLNLDFQFNLPLYMQRHTAKPGITGWAQVSGWRGETTNSGKMQKRIEHDLWYLEHWSFWLDMKIIYLTVLRIWSSPNAF